MGYGVYSHKCLDCGAEFIKQGKKPGYCRGCLEKILDFESEANEELMGNLEKLEEKIRAIKYAISGEDIELYINKDGEFCISYGLGVGFNLMDWFNTE